MERRMTREEAIRQLNTWGMSGYAVPVVAIQMAIEALSAEAEPKMTEEVREALMRLTMCAREECDMCKYKDKCGFEFQYNISTENMHTILDALSAEAVHKPDYSYEADMVRRLKESLSAEAEPTVIRCKTLLNAEDFEAVATRIRKENRNVIVIPCETEVASAEAVQGWIPCSERLPNESGDYLCTIPLDANETYTEVLTFHKGRFYEDDDEWGATYHDDVIAWMPLPKPYKQKTERRG